MKKITLFGPTIVEVQRATAVHFPFENPLTVTNVEAVRLVTAGVLDGEPEDTDGEDPPVGDGLEANTVSELTAIAAAEFVDLTGITLKADIIAAIRAHRAGA